MRWPGSRDAEKEKAEAAAAAAAKNPPSMLSSVAQYPPFKQVASWTDALKKSDWAQFKEPQAWAPPVVAVVAALGFSAFYRSYLRRIPTTNHIQPRFFRRRSLLGKVTSVGDGDNFHLFHTPGGRLAGWGYLRKVPAYRKDLKGQTIPIRIAGVDAPEGAHFGRPAQPYSGEALDFLTQYLLGRRVRAYLFRRDQYDRVVARVMVRRFFFFRRDVGIEMLKRGLATCYEAKTGAEFGGRETQYRIAEARAKAQKRGIWSGGSGKADLETPREYKTRMTAEEGKKEAGGATPASAAAKPAAAATPATATTATTTATPASTPKPGSTTQTPPSTTGSAKPGQQASSWGRSPLGKR